MSVAPYAVADYTFEASIGDGNAGKVFTARHVSDRSNSPSSLVAIKVIPRNKVAEAAHREVDLHFDLDHPNIANLYRVSTASMPTQSPSDIPLSSPTALAIVMEYGSAGDMFGEVAAAGVMQPRHFRRRLRHVASGLQYLHSNRIAHLDVKLENVIITTNATAKLIDFGCARNLDSTSPANTTLGGTLHYLAPEAVADQEAPPSTCNDAWALGVLCYTALVGNYPFNPLTRESEEAEEEETRRRILNSQPHPIPSSLQIPSDLRQIIAGLLEKDPAKRMTIDQVLELLDSVPDFPTRRFANRIYSMQHALPKANPGAQHRRPRSPSATPDADFAPSEANRPQSKEDALKIVGNIIHARMRAATELNRLFAPFSLKPAECDTDCKASADRRQGTVDTCRQVLSDDCGL